jgi:hypothetical protein
VPTLAWSTGATPVPQGSQVAYLRNSGSINRPIGLTRNDVLHFIATQRRCGTTESQGIGVDVNGVLQESSGSAHKVAASRRLISDRLQRTTPRSCSNGPWWPP